MDDIKTLEELIKLYNSGQFPEITENSWTACYMSEGHKSKNLVGYIYLNEIPLYSKLNYEWNYEWNKINNKRT